MRKPEYDYFQKFVEMINYSYQSATMLHTTLENFNVRTIEKKLVEIHKIEHNADLLKHDVMQHLAKEFIAPIEREDIVHLSQEIDNVTDAVEDVLLKIHMYNVSKIKPETYKFTKLIINCIDALKTALEELHNFKKSTSLESKLIEVNRFEEEGDTLFYDTMHLLFCNSKDPVELLIWSDLFTHLEGCSDACEHVADIIESVVMKNS